MKIWIDADACPRPVKEMVYRAALRCEIHVVMVANRVLATPKNAWVTSVVVASGSDVADDWITQRVEPEDVVITADVPLAARVVERGATGLNPRGQLYTQSNVRERLSIRDFMHDLREIGVQTGGPDAFGQKEKQEFANALDRLLTQYVNQRAREQATREEE